MRLIADELRELIRAAVAAAQQAGELPAFSVPDVTVERPKRADQGDWATPLALQSVRAVNEARAADDLPKLAPVQIAHIIARQIMALSPPQLARAEAAPPGFVNLTLSHRWLVGQVAAIRAAGEAWATLTLGANQPLQVEYVSANPTGPVHFGTARNAVFGDTLANVLEAAGYAVQREFYINDAGSQIRNFGASLLARYGQALGEPLEVPEGGYQGSYLADWGQELAERHGRVFLEMPREEAISALTQIALDMVLDSVRTDLARLNVHFDNWFSEQSLYTNGTFARVFELLQKAGFTYERDGATWFVASQFPGNEKDEVIIRRTGDPTYLASDMAYHYDKFVRRGFARVVDVWAIDHQGHVARMHAVMRAFDLDPKRLDIALYALVKLKRGGEEVKLSKRAGDIVTLAEVIDEVGADAVRFMLLTRAAESEMEFDLQLAAEQSNENPVYYIQYAHARIRSILRHAADAYAAAGLAVDNLLTEDSAGLELLQHPSEMALLRKMLELPEIIQLGAQYLAPHHLTHYAVELAGAFHGFYRDCRVVSTEPEQVPLSRARMQLVDACRLILARTLHLMGMSAPEQM